MKVSKYSILTGWTTTGMSKSKRALPLVAAAIHLVSDCSKSFCGFYSGGCLWLLCNQINTNLRCLFESPAAPRKEVYFMAVIDILQHYDAKKKAAHAAKTVKHGVCREVTTATYTHQTVVELKVRVWCPGRSGDLHGEPRAVLQEVLRFHHHYPVLVLRSGSEGAKRLVGNGEQVGEKWRSRNPTIQRCCGGIDTSLLHLFSLLIPPFLPAQVERHTAATNESIICLHLTSPFSCVTLDNKGVEHVQLIILYRIFLSKWLLMWENGCLLPPSNTLNWLNLPRLSLPTVEVRRWGWEGSHSRGRGGRSEKMERSWTQSFHW